MAQLENNKYKEENRALTMPADQHRTPPPTSVSCVKRNKLKLIAICVGAVVVLIVLAILLTFAIKTNKNDKNLKVVQPAVDSDEDSQPADSDEDSKAVQPDQPPTPPKLSTDKDLNVVPPAVDSDEDSGPADSDEDSEAVQPEQPPTPPKPTPKPSPIDEFRQRALADHNFYRQQHSAPPLVLDEEMCEYAQSWANHLASLGTMMHRPKPTKYGENIAMNTATYNSAVSSWYSEYDDYNFRRPGFSPATGHFTALVWKSTKRLGIAYAYSNKAGAYYIVANYDPPGNVANRFTENVVDK